MATPNKYSPATNQPHPPRCPYCSTELGEIACWQWNRQLAMGLAITFCVYCPNTECSKMIGTQIMLVPHAQEESMIARPS